MKHILIFILFFFLYVSSAHAYVGPGAGLGVIGLIAGVLISIAMAIIGIFWYPLKRLFKKKEKEESLDDSPIHDSSSESEGVQYKGPNNKS